MSGKIQKHSPLTQVMYYILLSLIDPLHGYGIIKRVEELSEQQVKLAAGTLYGALNSLLNHKLITLLSVEEKNKGRKTYQITDEGMELLRYEIARLKHMATVGEKETGGMR